MYNSDEILEIYSECYKTLKKLQNKKKEQKSLLEEVNQYLKVMDHARFIYEEYDSAVFNSKKELDNFIFRQLIEGRFEGINESNIHAAINSLYESVNKIYEFINIKPESPSYLTKDLLECSEQEAKRKVSDILYEYVGKKFYSLTPREVKRRYFDEAKDCVKGYLIEGEDIEDSAIFCIKKKLLEGFFRNLAFPTGIWSRVVHLTESEDYAKFFDQDSLINLVEEFNFKLENISKIFAAVI